MSSNLLTPGKIAAAGNGDWPTLLEFDRQGLFPAPEEPAMARAIWQLHW